MNVDTNRSGYHEHTDVSLPPLRRTPLLRLKSFPGVWLKCEHKNPSGSHKDRAYRAMLQASGISLSGGTFVDYTTGNGGISLAWLAREVGALAVVFMPEGMTAARSRLIRSYGAELVLTPREEFVAGARAAAEAYMRSHVGAILLSQSDNLANQRAFIEVGEELLTQLKQRRIRPVTFICAIGTGGIFSGIARVLKDEFSTLRAVGIEVPEAPIIWAKRRGKVVVPSLPSIIGMGAGRIAANTDERLIDDIVIVGATDIVAASDALSRADSLRVGPSTAANVLVASRMVELGWGPAVTVSFDRSNRED